MYFLAKNIRTCSRSFRCTQTTLLYKNGALNWDYLAKNASFFMMHPEQLKQKLKERDAHMLCRFFDSDEYQKKVKSFLEMQTKFLSKDSLAAPRRVKYQHVLSCAQPTHKKQKRVVIQSDTKQDIKVNEPKPKKIKKGTIIDQLMKRRNLIEAIHEAESESIKNHDGERKRMRHKTTIMPIYLKKMKKKHVMETNMKEGLFNSVYRAQVAKKDVSNRDHPESLYAQLLHRSKVNLKEPKSQTLIKELGDGKYLEDDHTLIFEGKPYKEEKFDDRQAEKEDESNTLTFKGTAPYKVKDYLRDDEILLEEPPMVQVKRTRYKPPQTNNENIEVNPNAYKMQDPLEKHFTKYDPHTLTFVGIDYKNPETSNRKDIEEGESGTLDKNSYKVQRRLEQDEDSFSTGKYQKSYKSYPKVKTNASKEENENSMSRNENFKGDPTPTDSSSYKFSNFSAKVDPGPYRLPRVNSKYEDVAFKLSGPSKSNISHIPLRMSSSTARVIHRGATIKLRPKPKFSVKKKNFSDLLCVEPTKLRTSKFMKTNNVPDESDEIVKVEVVKKSQEKRKGKGNGEERGKREVTPMQMLMEDVYKRRSLNLEDDLERKHTLVAILRNRGATGEKTQLEVPSLFEKVKTGSQKSKPQIILKPINKSQLEHYEGNTELTSAPKKETSDDHQSCTYKIVAKHRQKIDQRLKKKFSLNPPFWKNTFSVHFGEPLVKKSGQIRTKSTKQGDFMTLEENRETLGLVSRNIPCNLHRPVPHFVEHADKPKTYLIRLPKTTPEGYRVLMYAVRDPDPTKMNFNDVVKGFCMYNDCVLSEDGLQEGYIVIFDMKDVGLGHLARVSLPALKCFMYYIQDAHPCRLKQIHVLNTASWIHHVMRLVVPLVRSELLNLVRFHKGNIPDNFPVEVLPMDYGGEAPLVEDLDNTTKSLLEKYGNWLIESSEFKADESKRIKKASWWGLFSPKNPQQNDLDEKTILRNLQID